MADLETSQGEKAYNNSENDDVKYVTSFKLVAIMFTLNLSTMVGALDLVRRQTT
jgi:hypothetical protein